MIEFDGYISGKAKRHYFKKMKKLGRSLVAFSMLVLFPIILAISFCTNYWALTIGYVLVHLVAFLASLIPKTEKEAKSLLPKKVFTDEEYIVCVGEKFEEFRLISDATLVIDYDEFYDIIFPFGKVSDKFVCQKSLLVQGTLEDFEALFEGKIERRTE